MTLNEAILISAYTGYMLVPKKYFSNIHKLCEDVLARPLWTHEFANKEVQNVIQEKLRPQIIELINSLEVPNDGKDD